MSAKKHATEQLSLKDVMAKLPSIEQGCRTILARINRLRPLGPGTKILDVGAAQGQLVVACLRAGHDAIGVEPWDEAREVGAKLASSLGLSITLLPGRAESLPVESGNYDIVLLSSVVEHVGDAQATFNEACRVLKAGGACWFFTASSLCPRQGEINGFPLFGWYPDLLKRRIMTWAKTHKPHLVGHTQMPAMNWFTPWKARRMLQQAGFSKVYDRWDLRLETEGGTAYRLALKAIRLCFLTKLTADILVPNCSYLAVK